MSIGEWLPWLIAAGGAIKYLLDRRDRLRREAREQARLEASEKLATTATETVARKNEELAAKDVVIERRDRRIEHLETLLALREPAR